MRVARLAILAVSCCLVPALHVVGQAGPMTFNAAREYLSSCLYETSIREAGEGEPTFVYRDPKGPGFIQSASAPTNIVAGGLAVSGPRIVTEGSIPSGLYTVIVCGEENLGEAVKTTLLRGLGIEVTEAVRTMDTLALRIDSGGPLPGLRPGDSGETPSIRRMRDTLQVLDSPLSRVITVLETTLSSPVVDETGLDGVYSFTIEFDRSDPASLADALASELGLLLEADSHELSITLVRQAQSPPPASR